MAKNAYLYAPRMAYRFRDVEPPYAKGNDPVAGKNPPYGASLHYWIKAVKKDSAGKDKADSVTFTFADQNGAVVRTMKAPVKAGVNRAWWDLRADRTKEAKLRTSPEYAPWFPVSIEGRTAPGIGRFAMLVPPGRYTVKMSYDGASFTQPLDVIKDPNSAGSAQDVAAEVAMASALRADIDEAVGMIDNLELVRGQLGTLKTVLATDSTRKDLQTAADSLDAKALAAERRLFQTRVTGRGQDLIRWPTRVTERLIYLAASVDGSDFPPTDAQKQVQGELHTELQSIRTQVDQLVSRDLAAFNDLLRSKNVRNVIVLGGQ
jgi:hypothetical protein